MIRAALAGFYILFFTWTSVSSLATVGGSPENIAYGVNLDDIVLSDSLGSYTLDIYISHCISDSLYMCCDSNFVTEIITCFEANLDYLSR